MLDDGDRLALRSPSFRRFAEGISRNRRLTRDFERYATTAPPSCASP
jgi:hypothetical protein